MKYLIYKIINIKNNKFYIGAHKTNNADDGYMGSGIYLRNSIAKYGLEYFKKEILHEFSSENDMFSKEAEIVNEDFVARKDTYNIKLGGEGGWDYINRLKLGVPHFNKENSKEYSMRGTRVKNEKMKDPEWKENAIEKVKIGLALYYENNPGSFLGRTHTDETIERMKKSQKGKQVGEKNSQHGTCWIYSMTKQKSIKIKKEDVESYLSQGWIKGRRMSFD